MADISFYCDIEDNFDMTENLMRAFTYDDYSIALHSHEFFEINIILTGRGTHIIEEAQISAKAGDVFVINPQVAHAYENTKGLSVFHIIIKPEFFEKFAVDFADVDGFELLFEIEPYLRKRYPTPLFLHLSPAWMLDLQTDLEIISDDGAYNYSGSRPLKYHVLCKLLYLFSHLISRQTYSDKQKNISQNEQQIVTAVEYIHCHYGEKLTVDILRRNSYMSRSTFMRNFSLVCGCSVTKYITRYRKSKALSLIESSGKSKTEIAQLCGFYDLSHMERIIKKD